MQAVEVPSSCIAVGRRKGGFLYLVFVSIFSFLYSIIASPIYLFCMNVLHQLLSPYRQVRGISESTSSNLQIHQGFYRRSRKKSEAEIVWYHLERPELEYHRPLGTHVPFDLAQLTVDDCMFTFKSFSFGQGQGFFIILHAWCITMSRTLAKRERTQPQGKRITVDDAYLGSL